MQTSKTATSTAFPTISDNNLSFSPILIKTLRVIRNISLSASLRSHCSSSLVTFAENRGEDRPLLGGDAPQPAANTCRNQSPSLPQSLSLPKLSEIPLGSEIFISKSAKLLQSLQVSSFHLHSPLPRATLVTLIAIPHVPTHLNAKLIIFIIVLIVCFFFLQEESYSNKVRRSHPSLPPRLPLASAP